jgi:hypothetical protein
MIVIAHHTSLWSWWSWSGRPPPSTIDIIANLVKVEAEDQPFEPHNVWGAAWYRFKSKVGAKKEGVAQALRVAEARGNLPPSMERRTKPIEPLGAFDPEGNFKWDEKLKEKIESMTKKE